MTTFDPTALRTFRFLERTFDPATGTVRLTYGLDDTYRFTEEFDLPLPAGSAPWADTRKGTSPSGRAFPQREPLLDLLHWVAGVSYYKTAAPPEVSCETGAPPPATAALLDALYSEGLGEFAVVNHLPALPRPRFPAGARRTPVADAGGPPKLLVPVGGGKDSVVALEIVRRAGVDFQLFSVGDAAPIRRTAEIAGVPRLVVRRRLDPQLRELNAAGALNGHVPITAVVSCVALLTAALHGCTGVALANERSASRGNLVHDGIEVNHQFSKSLRVERLLSAAVAEATAGVHVFSLLRPASELAIARAFSRLPQYHHAFTSCNAVFRIDPELRAQSWCADCPKCRFVFLILAPFLGPEALRDIFGAAMLDDERQHEGFALLTATGGHKPFECVGEEEESLAAIELLADDPRWRDQVVVRRLAAEVLGRHGRDPRRLRDALALSDEHQVPEPLIEHVRAVLGA
ncbi:MAG TPA: hypothetical protein VFT50_12750 [Baekduia sp.]|nr:hypothetical protein [Baekduia sp.]